MKARQAKNKESRFKSAKTDGAAGVYRVTKASKNGSGYRSAKTGRYVSSNAPQISDLKQRTAAVGRATKRVKTAVTVDLPRSRRSK
ncbi:MAG TPA: hypothetical protein VFM94_05905 [Solirubrobacterales bacterium]|nr:hypothetical protein [Solirubrobacterales bacterium]